MMFVNSQATISTRRMLGRFLRCLSSGIFGNSFEQT